jgi:hypothetical protein
MFRAICGSIFLPAGQTALHGIVRQDVAKSAEVASGSEGMDRFGSRAGAGQKASIRRG